MDDTAKKNALDTIFTCDDLGRDLTLRDYFKELLETLIVEEEGFSGKRPFGNSGWFGDVVTALIIAGAIEGDIDDDGCPFDYDDSAATDVAVELIRSL